MPEERYIVRYAKRGKKKVELPVSRPNIETLAAVLKEERWKKIVVEYLRQDVTAIGERYSIEFTLAITPLRPAVVA